MPNWNPNNWDFSYVNIDPERVPGGAELYESILKQYRQGLPQDIVDMYLKRGLGSISGNLRSGEQELRESLAQTGGPTAALMSGLTKLYGEAGSARASLYDKVAEKNYDAKQQGLANYFGLFDRMMGSADRANQYRTNLRQEQAAQAQYADQGEFDWGSAAGGALEAGGTVAGAAISKGATCYCYAEAFGKDSMQFHKARIWARDNATEEEKQGYMVLSSWLVPIMRKSPLFKKLFKQILASPTLEQMQSQAGIRLKFLKGLCGFIGRNFPIKQNTKKGRRQLRILNSIFQTNATAESFK